MATSTIAQMQARTQLFMDKGIPTFIWGDPGIGKTQGIEQMFDDKGYPIMFLDLSTLEAIDLRGLPSIDQENKIVEWIPPEMLPNEKRDGKKGVLFMDELNVAHPSIQAACMPLVREGRIGTWNMPKDWYIVGAGNYQSNRASAQKMPTALADRFGHITAKADIHTFTVYANRISMNPMVVGFVRAFPEHLHNMGESEQIVFATPRSWEQVALICEAPDEHRQALIAGLVGDNIAGLYETFHNTIVHLPTIEEIIKDPKNCKIPTEPSALWAVATMIARHAEKKTFSAIMTYAIRLGREMEIVAALDATKRDPDLCEHTAFIEFAKRNQDIQI